MRDDLKKFKVDFDATDTNGSGTLSIGEVKAVLKAAGYTGSSNLMFFNLDKNKDFRVSRDEFQNVVGDSPKATEEEMALRREFQRIDSNKGGTLSQAELMGTLHGTGSSILPRETTEKILEHTVTDSDGEVSYDEFLRLVGFDDSESELRKIFSAIDKDLSGDLSREEMEVAAASADPELTGHRLQIFKVTYSVDLDFLGREVDFHRFVTIWMDRRATAGTVDTSPHA